MRVVRDIFSEHFERAIVDDEQQHHRLVSFFARTAPELVERVELWETQEQQAAVRGLRRRQGDRRRDVPARGPAQRRLPDHRLRRGADGDRRQLRQLHRPRQRRCAGGHDHQDQPRGRRGGRQPAAPARHRRDHRDRLHRHGPRAQPRRGHEDAAQDPRRGSHEDVHGRDLQARPGRDDPPERHRGRARDHEPALSHVRGRGHDQERGDDRDRVRAPPARHRRSSTPTPTRCSCR